MFLNCQLYVNISISIPSETEKRLETHSLGFPFPVVMLAVKRKRVSIWLPLKQSCSAHFIQEKDAIPRGYSRYMALGWYLGCFIIIVFY